MKTSKIISKFKKTIRIRGATWTIKLKFCLRDAENTPCLGIADPSKKLILIEKDLPADVFKETLLHEYLHAVWFESGIGDVNVSEETEHFLLNALVKDLMVHSSFWATILR